MLKYDEKMKPTLDFGTNAGVMDTIGLKCPVCGFNQMFSVQGDEFVEHEDGSATGRCSKCKVKLRQNAEGFIFVDDTAVVA